VRYLFKDYVLDTDRRELRHGAGVVTFAPQVFDLLAYLIRNRERIVSKNDLIAAIWGGRVVSETALTTRLYVARNAIGDGGEGQHLIKTLPRKGFRFVGTVREERSTSASVISRETSGSARDLSDRPSIVVLPFANLSGDPTFQLLSDGITEDVLTELSKLRSQLLIARNPRVSANKTAVDVRQVGRELGVCYVLEGSVRSMGDSTRVTGRLIDATIGVHIWGKNYDKDWANGSGFHDEMIQAIVSDIVTEITRADRQRAQHKLPENLGAWEAYQRGMWLMSKSDALENKLARTLFSRAIELDPNFGPGYSAMAWSYMASSSAFSELTVAESCDLGESLVRKAIAPDENDTDARSRLALTALLKGDLEGALQEADLVLSVKKHCADAWGSKVQPRWPPEFSSKVA
jgi:TolB-like protein